MSFFRTRCGRCFSWYFFGIVGRTQIGGHECAAIVRHFELVGGDGDDE